MTKRKEREEPLFMNDLSRDRKRSGSNPMPKKRKLSQTKAAPPLESDPNRSEEEMCSLAEAGESFGGGEEEDMEVDDGARPNPTMVPVTPVTHQPKQPRSQPRVAGTLANSIHAPGSKSAYPTKPPVVATVTPSLPVTGVRKLVGLKERLIARQQAVLEKEKENPWVFEPRPGQEWVRGSMRDPAAPGRTLKIEVAEEQLAQPGVLWAAAYGTMVDGEKHALCAEAARAYLGGKFEVDQEVLVVRTLGYWVLLKLPTDEHASALAEQQVILHCVKNTAVFFYPVLSFPQVVQHVFVNLSWQGLGELKTLFDLDRRAAIETACTAIAKYFKLPGTLVKEVPLFVPVAREDVKVGFRVYLVDPSRCETLEGMTEEEEEQVLAWDAVWGRKRSIVRVSHKPVVDINMLHPCDYCHSNDHGKPLCPWKDRGVLGEGVLLVGHGKV